MCQYLFGAGKFVYNVFLFYLIQMFAAAKHDTMEALKVNQSGSCGLENQKQLAKRHCKAH